MKNIVVVDSASEWPNKLGDYAVISDFDYLTHLDYQSDRNMRVFNLCRSYKYQTAGYYVSLLAAARGHKPVPSVETLQEMKSKAFLRITSEELDDLVQKSLVDIKADTFELSIYFGKNTAKKYEKLSYLLYQYFSAPLIRAKFAKKSKWQLTSIGPIALKDVPESHKPDLIYFAEEYFKKRSQKKRVKPARYSLAILVNPADSTPPSNEKAIKAFVKAAENLDMEVDIIGPDDIRRLAEYDALFIRETTSVTHHTFRFAQKAAALGLVVIDDPDSILKCTNKVYLSELLHRHKIPAPKTFILHKHNVSSLVDHLPLPCVLKQPDSAFSKGVSKANTREELVETIDSLLEASDLVLAQEFMPTDFDWRLTFIDNKPLFACKYYMALGHWQIYNNERNDDDHTGNADSIPISRVPTGLLRLAEKTAALIGNGLYGIDIKEKDGKYFLIEINDNPSIDYGVEDRTLKDELYFEIMSVFLNRLSRKTKGLPI
jgi:glutathione synthase/RimK-type ligase-like ATP-grasp enzyme